MEPQAPQIATGISADAEDCEVTFDGSVAPKTSNNEMRSLERWLENRLGEQHGACRDLAAKLSRGVIERLLIEAIGDPQLGAMLFCDHMEHTRVCNAAWHLTCCPQPLQSVPKGKWFCPTHAGTHASFPAFAVVTARTTHEEPISTRTEPIGARGDAHGIRTQQLITRAGHHQHQS
jgi:hypothetical protein